MTPLERFAGGPAATPTLIQLRRQAGELPAQHFYNVVIYHGIKVGQAHKIGQLFIYGDLELALLLDTTALTLLHQPSCLLVPGATSLMMPLGDALALLALRRHFP